MATNRTETQTKKTTASDIISYGLHPVHLGAGGDWLKRAVHKGWPTASYSLADVGAWASANNIGVRCGATRRGQYLYVFDFDKYAADTFPRWLAAVRDILPDLVIVKTARGFHVYVLTDEAQQHGIIARDADNGVITEIRGEGQYVVGPGSLHPSGAYYEPTAGSLADIPTVTSDDFKKLVAFAAADDRRVEEGTIVPSLPGANTKHVSYSQATSGELAGVNDCLDYARQHIGGERKKREPNGDIRFEGNGGLLITPDGRGWVCFADQASGGLVKLIAWHKNISERDAAAMLRGENVQRVGHLSKKETVTPTGELANELFPGGVMSMPMQVYFEGRYPHAWTRPHTCHNYMDVRADENGQAVFKRHTPKIWRTRTRRVDDLLIEACPGCQHDYAMKACWQVEVEAGAYHADEMPLRWQILPVHQVKKLIRAARGLDDFTLQYWKRPLMGGRVAIIHNVHGVAIADRKAHEMPRNRAKLYELVMGWILDVDAGRTSHSKGWGGDFKGTRGDGRSEGDRQEKRAHITVITEWLKAYDAVADYLQVDHVPNNHGLHIVKFLDILDDAGVRYGVQSGHDELKELRRSYNVHIGLKRKTGTMYAIDSDGVILDENEGKQGQTWRAPADYVGSQQDFRG